MKWTIEWGEAELIFGYVFDEILAEALEEWLLVDILAARLAELRHENL